MKVGKLFLELSYVFGKLDLELGGGLYEVV